MSKGLTNEIVTISFLVIANCLDASTRLGDITVSIPEPHIGRHFQGASFSRLPRAEALGCSLQPLRGKIRQTPKAESHQSPITFHLSPFTPHLSPLTSHIKDCP